jgi:nicotinate-nucleotide adenylyltransferase
MQRIGIMGGSFNPIHCGHLNLARAALLAGLVDHVLLLPSGNPPHKRAGLVDKAHRLNMVSLAVKGEAHVEVCREEVDREGVTYTAEVEMSLYFKEYREMWGTCQYLHSMAPCWTTFVAYNECGDEIATDFDLSTFHKLLR